MGNCCPTGRSSKFQGEGNRLGTANEAALGSGGRAGKPNVKPHEEISTKPIHDQSLGDEDRAKMRADRAAAAEARQKKQGGAAGKKKKATDSKPLTNPHSEPLMRWS